MTPLSLPATAGPVHPRVKNLASLMRLKRDGGEKFVLMLGAGASMSSGVARTSTIMEELLAKHGAGIDQRLQLEDRFDILWKQTPDPTRRDFLKPYLDKTPSAGYAKLAALVCEGYFDVALTFNFDSLLEAAVRKVGTRKVKTLIRGETQDDQMQAVIDNREPDFKLVKLHGSLESSDHFLFDINEMLQYPEPIHALVADLTSRNIVVCGYGFKDHCVTRAFAQHGESIVCVNRSGVPRELRPFLKNRRSDDISIDLEFEQFADELYRELLVPPEIDDGPPPANPFKFLEGYEESDSESFTGRKDEIAEFTAAVAESPPPRVIIVAGPARAGKTSLVRAGLIPALAEQTHRGIYVRCQANMAKSLAAELWPDHPPESAPALPAALKRLAKISKAHRIVLFVDQFDRATSKFDLNTREGRTAVDDYLDTEVIGAGADLTLVLVVVQPMLLNSVIKSCQKNHAAFRLIECPAFERKDVDQIIRTLAAGGGFHFDSRILDEMIQKYDPSATTPAPEMFTLAHIQAVCHILAATRTIDYDSYRKFDGNVTALHQAINVCDIISFLEDFPWSEKVWFRNMIKVALKKSKEEIADFIKAHYEDLVPKAEPRRKSSFAAGQP